MGTDIKVPSAENPELPKGSLIQHGVGQNIVWPAARSLAVSALGPYAWVQGRRATSKVTATSGGRLTNRYAWVTGRLTRCAYLGVNLPLRVPPCKRYPEEVTELN